MGLFYKDTNGNIHTVDGSQTQFTVLPIPSAALAGKIYQYIGNTTSTFTNGWFYKCVQGEMAGTYEWIPVAVQSGGGGTQVQSDWGQTDTIAVDFIKNKPTLGTASAKDVATSGDASATQVVMGNDSRLNNSISSTSTTSPLTDSADGFVQGVTVKGHSEKSKNLWRYGDITGITQTTVVMNYPTGLYTLSGIATSDDTDTNVCLIIGYSESTTIFSTTVQRNTRFSYTFNTSGNLTQIVFYASDNFVHGEGNTFSFTKIQIEEGSTATPYEPYGIKSIGDNGFTITTVNGDNTETSTATITTGLPLCSTLDGTVYDELTNEKVITRCEVVDDEVVPLATPTETPLTSAEKSALAQLRTYDSTTHIDATDEPTMTVDYLLNTNNGRAVANLDNKIKSGFDELKKESEHFVYAFYIDHNDTNPATCVHPYISKYGCDNYFYIPAKMNYTTGTFDYGSWRDFVYRIAKPCMVAYNGHVDYYLDPDDYSSKIDGYGVSDIDDMSYAGNVMVELDCLYFKRWKANNKSYVVISDQKLDKSFKAYAHHDKNGKVLEHIYLGAYNGSYDGTRLRSISDIECHNLNALTTNKIMSNTTRQQEMDFAMANNVQGEAGEGWFIRHKADWDYINTLLILIGMNTNTQATFGNGNISSYVSTSNTGILTTGTMNDKGLFYGKNDNVSGVKVFGIENWWGNMWVSIAGWNLVNGVQKIKMSYDQSDVSSVDGFNVTDGTGFATVSNSTPSGTNGGYISDWTIGDFGLIPTVASGASDKRLCDGLWFNNSANCFAFCGGGSDSGVHCGAFCTVLNVSASYTHWALGAALSYKPLSA